MTELATATQRFASLLNRPAPPTRAAPAPAQTPCAVRIVAGMHRGAALRLRGAAMLGSDEDNDIVLRDPEVLARHAQMRRVDGHWSLYDWQDGREIPAFQTGRRGRFVRQRHAIGAAQLVITQALPPEPAARQMPRLLSRVLAPALLVLAASLGAVVIVQLVAPANAGMVPGTRNLGREGWPDVSLMAAEKGPVVVRGYVDDPASLTRLQRWLNAQDIGHAPLMVRVGTELAARVRDALGDASFAVHYQPGGTVRVQGTTSDPAVRERVRRITADLAGAVRVDDRVAYVEAPDLTPKKHVLPMRIVDVRPGNADNTGSFGSENGARYFLGAVLPDGSEVVAINDDAIEFSMGGRRINYPLK
jgi:Inner membrane component of T3SS, cytoplasmic domain/BON domain